MRENRPNPFTRDLLFLLCTVSLICLTGCLAGEASSLEEGQEPDGLDPIAGEPAEALPDDGQGSLDPFQPGEVDPGTPTDGTTTPPTTEAPPAGTPAPAPAPGGGQPPVVPAPDAGQPPVVPGPGPAPTPAPGPAPTPGPAPADPLAAPNCVAAPTAVQQDLDLTDVARAPWARAAGRKVQVTFETRDLPARISTLLVTAAATWTRSACVAAVAVNRCQNNNGNCVRIRADGRSPDGIRNGDFRAEGNAVTTGGELTLYVTQLNALNDNGALAGLTHELGHVFGLRHRINAADVMNPNVTNTTNPNPDSVDFNNLLILYGKTP